MRKKLSQILKEVSDTPTTDRAAALQQVDSPAVRTVLKYAYDPSIKFALPKGKAPYKPCDLVDLEGRLYSELRRLYLFVEGGNPNLTAVRREYLFIQLLESIDKEDAELIVHVKDKKLPYKGINEKLVRKVFPDLLPVEELNEQDSKKK